MSDELARTGAMADGLRTRPRQRRTQRTGQFPITLPSDHIKRMLDRKATLIIRTAQTKAGYFEVHDAGAIRRNERHRRNLRPDLQEDPFVLMIEITHITPIGLLDLDLMTVRRTGFKTLEDFYLDWLHRRRIVQPDLEVKLCDFLVADGTRYLHEQVHLAYTGDPGQAVPEEPGSPRAAAALSEDELEQLTFKKRQQWDDEHRLENMRRKAKSLTAQLKNTTNKAVLRGVDVSPQIDAIERQLDEIKRQLDAA